MSYRSLLFLRITLQSVGGVSRLESLIYVIKKIKVGKLQTCVCETVEDITNVNCRHIYQIAGSSSNSVETAFSAKLH